MLAVVLAATLLAALASFTGIVTGYAVRRTLAGNPGTAVIVTASVSGPAAARAAERGGRPARGDSRNRRRWTPGARGAGPRRLADRRWADRSRARGRDGCRGTPAAPGPRSGGQAARHLDRRGAAGADHRDPATARPGEPVLAARRPAVPAAVRWRL